MPPQPRSCLSPRGCRAPATSRADSGVQNCWASSSHRWRDTASLLVRRVSRYIWGRGGWGRLSDGWDVKGSRRGDCGVMAHGAGWGGVHGRAWV